MQKLPRLQKLPRVQKLAKLQALPALRALPTRRIGLPSPRRGALLVAVVAIVVGTSGCEDQPPARPLVCGRSAAVASALRPQQCGATLDFTAVNGYGGALAVVHEREDAVVLVDGACTGTLIAAAAGPVVLTAGHCVGLGDRAVAVFNFEDDPDGEQLVTEGVVIERATEPDYALVQLDALPAAIAPTPLGTDPGDRLAIIQHPRGRRKVVAEGRFLDACDGLAYYTDLDTLVGSSGAGVLGRRGHLVAVHTDGDCDVYGGTNFGWTAAAIVAASSHLQAADLTGGAAGR